jgi:hypothetical protein
MGGPTKRLSTLMWSTATLFDATITGYCANE